ncbi:hypothetical protein ALT721_2450023 [Alteromonas alvinellae]
MNQKWFMCLNNHIYVFYSAFKNKAKKRKHVEQNTKGKFKIHE